MTTDSEKALERIRLMLPRTEANGASPAEVEAAAKHIGRLVMKHPQLLAGYVGDQQKTRRTPPPPRKTHIDMITFPHSGIRGETPLAILVVIRKLNCWLAKSLLSEYTQSTVTMPRWLAIEKGLI
jgi:hypothetical protein